MLTVLLSRTLPVMSILIMLCMCFAGLGSGYEVQPEVDTKSMLVQEGDPPMGRPVILSKEANLLAQPPSASWGSAAGATPFVQPSVQTGDVTGVTSHVPVDAPTQVVQVCTAATLCVLLHG